MVTDSTTVSSNGDARASSGVWHELALLPVRSLFPLTALLVLLISMVWGPWLSLLFAYAWWKLVARVG